MVRLKAILGPAGVGKSYRINQLIQEDNYFAYRTASTGIAAVNMGSIVGAQNPTTINTALRFFNAESLLRNFHKGTIYRPLKYIASNFKNIVIDEAFMLNAATLDIIVLAIQTFNEKFGYDLGLWISGDAGQLPPVDGKPIFEAKCWPAFDIEFLTEVKRQKNEDFIKALNCIRRGDEEGAYDYFKNNIKFVDKVDELFRGTTFYSTNSEVDAFNMKCINRLRGERRKYKAKLTGKADPSWSNIPQELELKKGCLIQLLYNDFDLGFANGDSAIVEELWPDSIYIQLLRKQRQLFLKPRKLYNFGFTSKGYRKTKPDGTLRVIHARLAYALTIHRAQGLTLDKVQLNLKGLGTAFLARQSGMLYTALSRVRTPEGLVIVGTIDDLMRCVYVDKRYKEWIR